jgi:hypothetical protein
MEDEVVTPLPFDTLYPVYLARRYCLFLARNGLLHDHRMNMIAVRSLGHLKDVANFDTRDHVPCSGIGFSRLSLSEDKCAIQSCLVDLKE